MKYLKYPLPSKPINHINNAINGGLMTKMDLIGQEGMLTTKPVVLWIEEGVVKYIWDEIEQQWVNLEDRRRSKKVNHSKNVINKEDL